MEVLQWRRIGDKERQLHLEKTRVSETRTSGASAAVNSYQLESPRQARGRQGHLESREYVRRVTASSRVCGLGAWERMIEHLERVSRHLDAWEGFLTARFSGKGKKGCVCVLEGLEQLEGRLGSLGEIDHRGTIVIAFLTQEELVGESVNQDTNGEVKIKFVSMAGNLVENSLACPCLVVAEGFETRFSHLLFRGMEDSFRDETARGDDNDWWNLRAQSRMEKQARFDCESQRVVIRTPSGGVLPIGSGSRRQPKLCSIAEARRYVHSPILFVREKDGPMRMCIEYCELNQFTVKNRYPLPRIDDLFDQLPGTAWSSKIELRSRYHQMKVIGEGVHKTASKSRSMLDRLVIVFTYGILVYSKTRRGHAKLLGIKVDSAKVEAVTKCEVSKTPIEIRSFLGLAGYYKRFFHDFSKMVMHVTKLVRRNVELLGDDFEVELIKSSQVDAVKECRMRLDRHFGTKLKSPSSMFAWELSKMGRDLKTDYWWPGMKRVVARYVKEMAESHDVLVTTTVLYRIPSSPRWTERDDESDSRVYAKGVYVALQLWGEVGQQELGSLEIVWKTKESIEMIRERLWTAQSRLKSCTDKRRSDLEFNVGVDVLLKVSPWKGVLRSRKTGLVNVLEIILWWSKHVIIVKLIKVLREKTKGRELLEVPVAPKAQFN
ncbi:hypothetical protein OSB04_017620 [Centaurea solstitialis]|uniref:Reverse transcriptase n=1 Tax=Centaurea solstitialis TaxID=347529 RepID=A0AA38T371_9ASTR|nr:hypothetical protein OSB04_017620 [Centaurea solstitialis]